MTQKANITILQTEDDQDYKFMIQELQKKRETKDLFQGRSESDIVKLILEKPLQETYENICGKRDGPQL